MFYHISSFITIFLPHIDHFWYSVKKKNGNDSPPDRHVTQAVNSFTSTLAVKSIHSKKGEQPVQIRSQKHKYLFINLTVLILKIFDHIYSTMIIVLHTLSCLYRYALSTIFIIYTQYTLYIIWSIFPPGSTPPRWLRLLPLLW